MVHSWRTHPTMKVEADSIEIQSDVLSAIVHRPENAVSTAIITANNYKGRQFLENIDTFTILKVSFRYGDDSWTQVFEGTVEKCEPILTQTGWVVGALANGYGVALRETHCNRQFGAQIVVTLDTPTEIWDYLVDNYVKLSFGVGATGHNITKTKIKTITNPTIPFLDGKYRSNLILINEVCKFYNAYQAGSAGVHWFVDPSQNLWIDSIGAHTVDTANWPTWWNINQADSTLVQGADFTDYKFTKTNRGFANKIIVASAFRKPGYDYWTEGHAADWGQQVANPPTNLTDDAVEYIVGSESLNVDMDKGTCYIFWPNAANADWDLTKIGSEETIPTVNFYFYKDVNLNEASCSIRFYSTDIDNDYYRCLFSNWGTDPNGKWIHRSIPIGPYWKSAEESRLYRWIPSGGTEDWADIDGLGFRVTSDPGVDTEFLIDDLHISGKIIREAYNSTSIAAYTERQHVMRLDTAIDDSLKESVDTGTAAMLAYNELLLRQTLPHIGQITTPGLIEALPGQLLHIHADTRDDGSFRVNDTFRAKEIIHSFTPNGFTTTWDITNDILNTFARGFKAPVETMARLYHIDPEAQNLKGSGIDVLVDRLSKDYP